MKTQKLGELVGKPYEAREVQAFVATLGEPRIDDEIGAPETVYYTFDSAGVELATESETRRIDTLFLMAGGAEQPGYRGPLPHGLSFSMSRGQVHKALRPPDDSRSFYDAWEEGDYVLRVEYDDEKIKMIVLMGG